MTQYSKEKKCGCPTCDGIDAKTCMRCRGMTRMCDWWNASTGWAHVSELGTDQKQRPNFGNH